MQTKFYATFIVSKEPIDLGKLGDNPAVTHLINEEFNLESNRGWTVTKSVPHHCDSRDPNRSFHGIGDSVSVVIADWFKALVSSMVYCSLQRKREGE